MAYIDIPSSLQHVNLATLDIKDFGLATAGNVSNVVVVLNVYNTATANSWDYEAYLINNDQTITANYASNVFHSNSITSERVFIFNADTFTKQVIESESFGFRYRPRSDGLVGVYVGNVRMRITNTQPANGVTSYISRKALSEGIGLSVIDNAGVKLTKNVTLNSSPLDLANVNLTRSASVKLSIQKQGFVSKAFNLITAAITSLTANLLSNIQTLVLNCSMGCRNTAQKSASSIKSVSSKVSNSIKKDVSVLRNATVLGITSIRRFLTIQKSITASTLSAIQKSARLTLSNAVKSITTIASNVTSGLQVIVLYCTIGANEIVNKYTSKLLNPKVQRVESISKRMNGVRNLVVETKGSISKYLTKSLNSYNNITSSISKRMMSVKNLTSEVRTSTQKMVWLVKNIKTTIQTSVQKAISTVQEALINTLAFVFNIPDIFAEWFHIPLTRINAIFKKDKVATLTKTTIETVKKRLKL